MLKTIIVVTSLLVFIGVLYFFSLPEFENKKTAQILEKNELLFGVHPYLEEKSLYDKFQPLVDYLSKGLNKNITLEISPSYTEHLKRVGSDYYDISYIGPATYIEMVEKYGEKYILASMTTYNVPYFNGIIFVPLDSSIYTLKDLKGKSFAFGKPTSTMSSVIPTIMLNEAGIKLADLNNYKFLKNHEDVVKNVLSGNYTAGAVKEAVFDKYKKLGLRQIARSRHVSEHVFIAANSMRVKSKQQIENLLLTIADTQQGKDILFMIKPKSKKLTKTKDYNFNSLRDYLDINSRHKWDFQY
jgi:phosphonate transport system substrate-binding protein